MERTRPLNERQLKVLGLIGGGDDLSSDAAVGFRNTARALPSRGLVSVSRAEGRWWAAITEAGRYYLEHGAHPEARTPATSERTPRQRDRSADAPPAAHPRYGPLASKQPAAAGTRHRDAAELIERLRTERIVDLHSLSEAEQGRWRKTIDYAKRHGLVPEGHRIECNHPAAGAIIVRLVAAVHPTAALKQAANLPPVTVPERLDQSHPVIVRLRDDTERMAMPGEVRHRSLRMLQGLAMAAVERGWQIIDMPVDLEGCHTEFQQAARYRAGGIEIKLGEFGYAVTVDQKSPQTPDPVKAGYLKLTLPQSHTGLQSTWADAKTVPLERRLPEAIEALAHRAAADQERITTEVHAKAAQQETRAADAARSRSQAVELFLEKELDRQARALERWRLLTAYCDRLKARLDAADPQAAQTESARAWLAWARTHTAAIDPFKELPGMPAVPDHLTHFGRDKVPFGPMPDVFAGRTSTNLGRTKMWEAGRRFHPNG